MIRELRKSKGLTQKQLAEKIGNTRSTVSKWETGAAMPRTRTVRRLANALGCTIDALYAQEDGDQGEA